MYIFKVAKLLSLERKTALDFKHAAQSARNRTILQRGDIKALEHSYAKYLPALNGDARVRWIYAMLRAFAEHFDIKEDDVAPGEQLTWVTLVDRRSITADDAAEINLDAIKRRYQGCLRRLSYVG